MFHRIVFGSVTDPHKKKKLNQIGFYFPLVTNSGVGHPVLTILSFLSAIF